MARPRKDTSGPGARERLANAFWTMLSEMTYSEMTVSAISSRAKVNHNTFYYYFGSIEEMARVLFDENMLPELPKMLLPVLSGGVCDLSTAQGLDGAEALPDLSAHFSRARLFAQSDSSLLVRILRDSIRKLWLDAVGLEEGDLSVAESDQLTYIFGGLVALIATMGEDASPERMAQFVESPAGRGIFATLSRIAAADERENQTNPPVPSV